MAGRNNRVDFVEFPSKSGKDLALSKKFFSNVFGWSYTDWGDDYADTKDSGVGTGINADPVFISRGKAVPLQRPIRK